MKIGTTLALLLLTGCASNGQGIADSIAAVTKPLLTVDTPSEDPSTDSEVHIPTHGDRSITFMPIT